MEEIEFISEKQVKKTIENFSIEELIEYKKKLYEYILLLENDIKKKIIKKKEADKFFN
tara:strand:- start:12 stop:185 length:174 start_codon:yes stop_codon:yes gene_type:complete